MQNPDNATHEPSPAAGPPGGTRHRNWWYLLLLLPLAGLIYPPLYARMDPMLGNVPFFIWYQFAWIFGGIATTVIVSKMTD